MYHTIEINENLAVDVEISPKHHLERTVISKGTRMLAQLRPYVVEIAQGPIEVADLFFEDGTTVYHSGDTDVFGDMQLIGELYAPHVAVVPIGGHYTMGPRGAGRALEMVGAAVAIPVHYATFPALAGTPQQLREHTSVEVVALEPGETWEAQP